MNHSVSIKLIGILFWKYLVPFIRNEFESWIIPIPFFYPHPYDLSGNNRIEIIKPILEGGAEIFMMWELEVHDRLYILSETLITGIKNNLIHKWFLASKMSNIIFGMSKIIIYYQYKFQNEDISQHICKIIWSLEELHGWYK